MAVPVYVGTAYGSGTSGTSGGSISVPAIAGVIAGDLLVVFVETANQLAATPEGYAIAPSSPQGIGSAGAAGGTRLSVFYKIATGADGIDTVQDSGDHQIANKVAIRGVDNTSPFNASAGSAVGPTTDFAYPSITTTVNDCFLLFMVGNDLRTLNIPAPISAEIEDSSIRATQRAFVGTAGTLVLSTASKATAGIVAEIPYTDVSATASHITLALTPTGSALPDITATSDISEDADALSSSAYVATAASATNAESPDALISLALSAISAALAELDSADQIAASAETLSPEITASLELFDQPDSVLSDSSVSISAGFFQQESSDQAELSATISIASLLELSELQDTAHGSASLLITAEYLSADDSDSVLAASTLRISAQLVSEQSDDTMSAYAGASYLEISASLAATDDQDSAVMSAEVSVSGAANSSDLADSLMSTTALIISSSAAYFELADIMSAIARVGYKYAGGSRLSSYIQPQESSSIRQYGIAGIEPADSADIVSAIIWSSAASEYASASLVGQITSEIE